MLRYNTITNREPKPRAASDILRRKERIENLRQVFRRNSDTGVFDFNEHVTVGFHRAQCQGSTIRHRIDRVCGERDDCLLQLTFVTEDQGKIYG